MPNGHGIPPPPPGGLTADPKKAELQKKKKEWMRVQRNRFAEKRKGGFVETQKVELPPEHLRKVVNDIGYKHEAFQHCPQGELHEAGKCYCDITDDHSKKYLIAHFTNDLVFVKYFLLRSLLTTEFLLF